MIIPDEYRFGEREVQIEKIGDIVLLLPESAVPGFFFRRKDAVKTKTRKSTNQNTISSVQLYQSFNESSFSIFYVTCYKRFRRSVGFQAVFYSLTGSHLFRIPLL